MHQQTKFADRLEQMTANGLVNVRITLRHDGPSTSAEDACREVNVIYDALENGQCRPLNFNDARR